MKWMITGFSEKKGFERVLAFIAIFCSVSTIFLAIMQIAGIWDNSITIEILMGIVLLIQARENWAKNRKQALFSLCVALFILVCTILIIVRG